MPPADRDRLAARTQAQYDGFGYSPLFAGDLNAAAAVMNDMSAIAIAAAPAVPAAAAAAASALAAAASVPATADITTGRRLSDTAIWSMLRATPAWGFNSLGDFEETAVDTLRWEFNPVTLAPFGAAFAGARTNTIRNPRMEGAAAGSPGTQPTQMVWPLGATNGVTAAIAAEGTSQGRRFVDIALSGTASSNAVLIFQFETVGTITAALDQVWSMGLFASVIAGSASNFTVAPSFRSNIGGVGLVGAAYLLTGTTQFLPFTGTLPQVGTTSVIPSLRLTVASGVTVSATIRISLPQMEFALFASSPIVPPASTPGASSRAQGTVSIPIPQLGTRYNPRQGIIIVDWNSQPGPFASSSGATWFGLFSLGDTTADNVWGLLVNPLHTVVEFRRIVATVPQTVASRSMTAPAAGETIRCAVAWDMDAGLIQVAARGAVGTQLTGQTLFPATTHAMPGRFGTTHPLFGRYSGGPELRPAALFGVDLAALT